MVAHSGGGLRGARLVGPREMAARGALGWVRAALGVLGVAALGYAMFGFLAHVPPSQLIGVAAWLAVALLVHDGVLCPLAPLGGRGLSGGFTFDSSSVEQLRTVLETSLENPELVAELGAQSKNFVVSNYNWDAIASETRRVYQRALEAKA